MTELDAVRDRLLDLYRQMAITAGEHLRYGQLAEELSKSEKASTVWLSRAFANEPCKNLRRDLRRMVRWGLVDAHSNGFNNIYWSLRRD